MLGLTWRQLTILRKNPSLFLPPMLFPLINFTAFAGGLSRLRQVPGFDFAGNYTAFVFVFVLLQSAAFGGVFTGFGIARDFERGFARRLMIGATHRSGIIWGYALAALVRWSLVAALVTIVALVAHMQVGGSGIDLVGLYTLAAIVNVTGLLWACGIAMRFRSVQAGPLMQMPIFIVLFLAPVYVPLALLHGWIHAVARLNPITYVVEAGRGIHLAAIRSHVALAVRGRTRHGRVADGVGSARPEARRADRVTLCVELARREPTPCAASAMRVSSSAGSRVVSRWSARPGTSRMRKLPRLDEAPDLHRHRERDAGDDQRRPELRRERPEPVGEPRHGQRERGEVRSAARREARRAGGSLPGRDEPALLDRGDRAVLGAVQPERSAAEHPGARAPSVAASPTGIRQRPGRKKAETAR